MNLGDRVECGRLAPDHVGMASKRVQSITANALDATKITLGGADLQTSLTSLAAPVDWTAITNKPAGLDNVVDWTQDQGDTNIDANNIPLLNYAPNTLASNGAAGLSNYNLTLARKDKLAGIETGAQVNPAWVGTLLDGETGSSYVQNAVGDVPLNRTVTQLRGDYSNLGALVKAMLQIGGAPVVTPTITGAALTFTTTAGDVELHSAYPARVDLSFNRGTWVNAFDASGNAASTLPHNDGSVTLSGALGLSITALSNTITTVSSPPTIAYYLTSISGTFAAYSTQTLTATLLTSSTGTGDVFDNYGTATAAPVSQTFTAQLAWSVYKPVYVNGSKVTASVQGSAGAGGQSGLYGTVKVFPSTSTIIVVDHVHSHTIDVPFSPTSFEIYLQFQNAWVAQTAYSVASTSVTLNGTAVTYYRVTWTGASRDPVDVRLQ